MSLLKNKIKYGLKNVYYAVAVEDTEGDVTYEKPKPIPGAVNLSLSPQGEPVEFYADDRLYFNQVINDGYQGDLEIALVPDTFATECLGESADVNGAIFENAEAKQKHFALLFEFTGDISATRHVLYYCLAARPNIESGTKGKSVEPKSEKLSLTVSQHPKTRDIKIRMTADANKEAYDNWYAEVYEKADA